jgi:DNA-binding transcriptional MerR regulator
VYPLSVIKRVQFIRKAKRIGFTLSEITWLLASAKQKSSTCQEVETWASRELAALDRQTKMLTALRKELSQHRRRWRSRLPCPPLTPDEICCLIEELPLSDSDSERR